MIIINQDRSGMYNFDNIFSIEIINMEEHRFEIVIDNGKEKKSIGIYKTQKRAYEVLNEIFITEKLNNVYKLFIDNVELFSKLLEEYQKTQENLNFNYYKMPKK